jgi:hypothetical protein
MFVKELGNPDSLFWHVFFIYNGNTSDANVSPKQR